MTKEETIKILAILKGSYPHAYKGMSKDDALALVELWSEMFAEDDFRIVSHAVKSFLKSDTKGFPPVIGQIAEKIRFLTEQPQMSEMEAWGHILKALRRSNYHAEEEFLKLPELLQGIVGSPNQLREWAGLDIENLQTVVQSNFMRSYKAKAKYQAEYIALPSDVKHLIAGLGESMRLPGSHERFSLMDKNPTSAPSYDIAAIEQMINNATLERAKGETA